MPVQRLDYNSLTSAIINYLAANSSTLDNAMYSSVSTIAEFRPDEKSLYASQFPAISVDLLSHEEEREEIGMGLNARRIVTCTWDIGCHIRNITSYTAVVQSMRTLVANVEHALRQDDTLSSSVNDVIIDSTDFGNTIRGENGNWQKNGKITMQTVSFI